MDPPPWPERTRTTRQGVGGAGSGPAQSHPDAGGRTSRPARAGRDLQDPWRSFSLGSSTVPGREESLAKVPEPVTFVMVPRIRGISGFANVSFRQPAMG